MNLRSTTTFHSLAVALLVTGLFSGSILARTPADSEDSSTKPSVNAEDSATDTSTETDRDKGTRRSHPKRHDEEAGSRDKHAPSSKEDRRRFRSREGPDEMVLLDRLLAMPPEQLARVRHALERIEAMTAEERENLRGRLREFRKIPHKEREKMREQWKSMDLQERRQHIREMRERRWERILEEAEAGEEESSDAAEDSAEKD